MGESLVQNVTNVPSNMCGRWQIQPCCFHTCSWFFEHVSKGWMRDGSNCFFYSI